MAGFTADLVLWNEHNGTYLCHVISICDLQQQRFFTEYMALYCFCYLQCKTFLCQGKGQKNALLENLCYITFEVKARVLLSELAVKV